MATYIWDGSTDGDTTDATNWTPGGGPPGDADTIIFPSYASVDVDGNADFPAGSADGTGFEEVIIEDGVTYNIGSRTTPLELYMDSDTATNKLTIGGTGTYFLSPKQYNNITITSAGSAPATGTYAVNLTAMLLGGTRTGIINILCEANQSIGIAAEAGEIAEVDSLVVHGGEVTVGSGVTDNDASTALPVEVLGGIVVTNMPITIAKQDGGTWTHMTGAVSTSLTIDNGNFFYHSDGTAAAVIIGEGGILDMSQDPSARTFSKCDLFAGAALIDPNETVTYTAGIDLNQCRPADVTLDVGRNFRITKGSVGA